MHASLSHQEYMTFISTSSLRSSSISSSFPILPHFLPSFLPPSSIPSPLLILLPPFLPSLTALKVVVGILLLVKAGHYCQDRKPATPQANPSSHQTNISVSSHISTQSASTGELTKRTSSTVSKSDSRKQRSLSEVERYTLVSNRIV